MAPHGEVPHGYGGDDVTISMPDESQQKAARIAGLTYLLTFVIVLFANFALFMRLNVPGDAAATARSLLAHEGQFRTYMALDLVYCIGNVVLLAALYVLLAPVHRGLALAAAFFRLVFVLMWTLATTAQYFALRIFHGTHYMGVFPASQLEALGKLVLGCSFETYYVGLPFWAMASTVCGCLWLGSRQIPRWLAWWGVIGSGWCVLSALAFIAIPDFDKWVNPWAFDSPMALFEIVVGAWLLIQGVGPKTAATAPPR